MEVRDIGKYNKLALSKFTINVKPNTPKIITGLHSVGEEY